MEQRMKTFEMTDDKTEFERYQAYFCNEGLLSKYRDETEKAMQVLGEDDYEIYRPHRIDAYFPYSTRSADQKADYNIAMFAVAQNEHNFQYVPDQLRTPEFIRTAFKLNPRVIKVLPIEQAINPELGFLVMVAKYKPELLEVIGVNKIQNIAAQAVAANPSVYMQLAPHMQRDQQLIYLAVNKPQNSNIKDEFYKQNRDYVEDVLNLPIPDFGIKPRTMTEARSTYKPKGLGPTLKYHPKDDKDDK
jgi:hypothetical protein